MLDGLAQYFYPKHEDKPFTPPRVVSCLKCGHIKKLHKLHRVFHKPRICVKCGCIARLSDFV